jgi:carboxyl-terminal processing protease
MKNTAAIIFRSLLLLLAGIMIGLLINSDGTSGNGLGFSAGKRDKLSNVLRMVDQKYVDSVNTDSIENETINKVLQGLDPHSLYLPPEQAQSVNERLEGGFVGIGIEYQLLRDTIFVTQVNPTGPAYKAGIRNGDKIIKVDKLPLAGKNLAAGKLSAAFRGAANSFVNLSVIKAGTHTPTEMRVTRGRVVLSSLDVAYIASPGVGYIKISKFASTTDKDFRAALKRLKAQGLQKLVLDLRGNGGGYLNTATALADEFLPKGKLIVYTRGVHEPRTDYFATDSGMFEQGKLAILIDEYSASASEILAGALQDLDRAVIVGRRSFGKGLVQEQFSFNDGSAVNLTVARYYTPSGRSIQKSYQKGLESYRNELADRLQKGELYSAQNNLQDSIFKRPSNFHTSLGKTVYSGGGIMPDVFIPADTTRNNQLIYQLSSEQLFTAYALDKLQPATKMYATLDQYIDTFNITDEQLSNFVVYASKTIKQLPLHEINRSKAELKLLIKGNAARLRWGNEAFYRILNHGDAGLQKAVEALK